MGNARRIPPADWSSRVTEVAGQTIAAAGAGGRSEATVSLGKHLGSMSSLRAAATAAAMYSVLKEGLVLKSSGFLLKSWQPRFLVVTTDGLQYYTDQADTKEGRPPKGTVDLDGLRCSITDSTATDESAPYGFQIQFPLRRLGQATDDFHTYRFCCKSKDERAEWLEALEAAELVWRNNELNAATGDADSMLYNKVGLIRKRSSDSGVFKWRLFALDGDVLCYSRQLVLSSLDERLPLSNAAFFERVETIYNTQRFYLDIFHQNADPTCPPTTLQFSVESEMGEWLAALTISSKMRQGVPLCALLSNSNGSKFQFVAHVLLGTWRKDAPALLRLVGAASSNGALMALSLGGQLKLRAVLDYHRAAAGGAWRAKLNADGESFAVHAFGVRGLAMIFVAADDAQDVVDTGYSVLEDRFAALERELENVAVSSTRVPEYSLTQAVTDLVHILPLNEAALSFEGAVRGGPRRLQSMLFEALQAMAPSMSDVPTPLHSVDPATPLTPDCDTTHTASSLGPAPRTSSSGRLVCSSTA